jgi:hypothetical protein
MADEHSYVYITIEEKIVSVKIILVDKSNSTPPIHHRGQRTSVDECSQIARVRINYDYHSPRSPTDTAVATPFV